MFKMDLRFNGRKITSGAELEREMKKAVDKHVEDRLRKAAGSGVHMKKTREGYIFEGSPEQIERMRRRLC